MQWHFHSDCRDLLGALALSLPQSENYTDNYLGGIFQPRENVSLFCPTDFSHVLSARMEQVPKPRGTARESSAAMTQNLSVTRSPDLTGALSGLRIQYITSLQEK